MPDLPHFNNPPVVERIISAQFLPVQQFSSIYGGWFWKQYLEKDWATANEAPPLDDLFERFGEERKWAMPQQLKFTSGLSLDRVQIVRRGDERMIQLQNSRFVYNWRKKSDSYTRYADLLSDFFASLNSFTAFLLDSGLGAPAFNQWEITYINHLMQGDLWETPADWNTIIPGLYTPPTIPPVIEIDSLAGQWHMPLVDRQGRLHITASHVRVGGSDGPECLKLEFVARGPADPKRADANMLRRSYDLGHEAIVRTFTEMTSPAAHIRWDRAN